MAKRYTLREIFSNVHGTSFVGLDTETVVKLKGGKKNEQQGRVTKRTIGSQVMVFSNTGQNGYENMVKRRLVEEGKNPDAFTLGERKWGTRVPNLPIIEHDKDGIHKEYLEAIFQKAGVSEYFLDGKPINKEDIEGLDAIDEVEPLVSTGQGGLEDKVFLRTFSEDSLLNVRVDGAEYQFK